MKMSDTYINDQLNKAQKLLWGGSETENIEAHNIISKLIRDQNSQVVGFGARKLYEEDQGPKYLNTPETPFMSSIGKTKATAVYHEWQTDSLAAATTANAAVEGADASDATL